ncbi:hypothetical protein ACI2OX_11320 [Bacillus sp. N9]
MEDGIDYIVCNDLQTLIWLGNQLAIEFHIPFQTIHSKYVSEIVFDLDPPSRAEFHLAVKAARLLKEALDKLQLASFVKLSGNKGMQVYIPFQNIHLHGKKPVFYTIDRHISYQGRPRLIYDGKIEEKSRK